MTAIGSSGAAATGTIIEVDFDSCVVEVERAPGSVSGGDLHRGDRLRCHTHGLSIEAGVPTYFQAVRDCMLVAWGSPRVRARRATRVTDHLSADDIVKMYLAMLRANAQGMLLTYFATITWAAVGLTDDREIQFEFQRLLGVLRAWANRGQDKRRGSNVTLAWIWCHERGPRLGMHTHILAYVTPRHEARLGKVFVRFLEGVRERHSHGACEDGVHAFKAITPRAPHSAASVPSKMRFQKHTLRYMMKGVGRDIETPRRVTAQAGELLWRSLQVRQADQQGTIIGKRCGYSTHNLGPAAFASTRLAKILGPTCVDDILDRAGFSFDGQALQLPGLASLAGLKAFVRLP